MTHTNADLFDILFFRVIKYFLFVVACYQAAHHEWTGAGIVAFAFIQALISEYGMGAGHRNRNAKGTDGTLPLTANGCHDDSRALSQVAIQPAQATGLKQPTHARD